MDNETFEASSVCPSSSKPSGALKKGFAAALTYCNLFPTFAIIKVVNCARGTFTLASADDAADDAGDDAADDAGDLTQET